MPLTTRTVATIDQRAKGDPDFAAAVDAELRHASGMSQRQPTAKLGIKR
jgi:hypothetical protein